jgi:DNA-binding MarR family transcriptional regulator
MEPISSFEMLRNAFWKKFYSRYKLSWPAKMALLCLASHYNHRDEERLNVSQTTIAEEIGSTRTVVNEAIAELKKIGLIKTNEKAGFTNTYFFTTLFLDAILAVRKEEKKLSAVPTPSVVPADTPLSSLPTQTNKVTNNEQKKDFFKKNSIRFSKWEKYFETFKLMNAGEVENWKNLEGYDKEKYLIQKAKDLRSLEISRAENARRSAEIQADKQPDPFTNRDFAIKTIKDSGINAFTVNLIKRHQISDAEIAA